MAKRRTKTVKHSARRLRGSGAPAVAPAALPPVVIKRTVDLGREEELVTWDEWMARSNLAMRHAVPEAMHDRLVFRVTLGDRRRFLVRQVFTHVARGFCTIGPSRWNEREAICDVITGYMLIGMAADGEPSALCVPPTFIRGLECVLMPTDEEQGSRAPFGFYKREDLTLPQQKTEVEEVLALGPI